MGEEGVLGEFGGDALRGVFAACCASGDESLLAPPKVVKKGKREVAAVWVGCVGRGAP